MHERPTSSPTASSTPGRASLAISPGDRERLMPSTTPARPASPRRDALALDHGGRLRRARAGTGPGGHGRSMLSPSSTAAPSSRARPRDGPAQLRPLDAHEPAEQRRDTRAAPAHAAQLRPLDLDHPGHGRPAIVEHAMPAVMRAHLGEPAEQHPASTLGKRRDTAAVIVEHLGESLAIGEGAAMRERSMPSTTLRPRERPAEQVTDALTKLTKPPEHGCPRQRRPRTAAVIAPGKRRSSASPPASSTWATSRAPASAEHRANARPRGPARPRRPREPAEQRRTRGPARSASVGCHCWLWRGDAHSRSSPKQSAASLSSGPRPLSKDQR
jgi:hypothetical protein